MSHMYIYVSVCIYTFIYVFTHVYDFLVWILAALQFCKIHPELLPVTVISSYLHEYSTFIYLSSAVDGRLGSCPGRCWVLLCHRCVSSTLLAEANFPKWLYQFTFLQWCQPWIYNPLCLLFNHNMFGYFLSEWINVTEVVWFDPWPFLYHCIFIYLCLIVWFELT